MNPILKIGLIALLSSFALSSSAMSQNRIYAPELPTGAQVKREKPSWGKQVNGLQLGISLDFLNRPYSRGEVAMFTLEVRNMGKKPLKLTSYKPDWSISPRVVGEKGKPLSLNQQSLLFGPAYSLQVSPVSVVIAPNQILKVAQARLTIGSPVKDSLNPTIDVVPGKYQVSYGYSFSQDLNESRGALPASWVGKLTSGKVLLEVAPRNAQT